MFSLKFGKAIGSIYSFQFLIQNHGYSFAKEIFSRSNKVFFSQEEADPGFNKHMVLFASLSCICPT